MRDISALNFLNPEPPFKEEATVFMGHPEPGRQTSLVAERHPESLKRTARKQTVGVSKIIRVLFCFVGPGRTETRRAPKLNPFNPPIHDPITAGFRV